MKKYVTLRAQNEHSYIDAEYDETKGTLRILTMNGYDVTYEDTGRNVVHWIKKRKSANDPIRIKQDDMAYY